MKNFISISLTILLLLNVMGYYGLFIGLQYQNDVSIIKRLDNDTYDTRETVSIKIPITIPYATDRENFDRVDGQFQYNGQFYRLVKQRLMGDTLHIICIKDHQTKRIQQALTDYVKTFTDRPVNEKPSSKISFLLIKDYVFSAFSIDVSSIGWSYNLQWDHGTLELLSHHSDTLTHPPEKA